MDDTAPPVALATTTRPATLRDVAALSGVATSTVSRALARPDRVHWATRRKIEQAARTLGYLPATVRRPPGSLRLGVALVVPDVANPYFFGYIRSTQRQLTAAGYAHVLIDTEEDPELEQQAIHANRHTVVGLILAATRLSTAQLLEAAQAVPLVTINRDVAGLPTVIIDTASGVRQAAEHLYSLGHRDIAYVAGPVTSWSDARRWEALQDVSRTLGCALRRLGPYPPDKQSGAAAADALLNTSATACIAFNDLMAIGMLMRLGERGVSVPGQISVVGCDDIFGADFCSPPLTTLTSPIDQAGRMATDLLLSRLHHADGGGSRHRVTLHTHLTVRASTGAAPSAAVRRM